MTVAEWISAKPGLAQVVAADRPLEQLIDLLLSRPEMRDIYVVDSDQAVLGHVSRRKLVAHYLADFCPVQTRRQLLSRVDGCVAAELMDANFAYARPEEELDAVLYRHLEHDLEELPVLDRQNRLLGSVNLSAVIESMRSKECGGE